MLGNLVIPDWRSAFDSLKNIGPALVDPTSGEATLDLSVAGKSLDPTKRGYPAYFPRDLFTTAFLLDDKKLLEDTLLFAASHLGRKRNPDTAEEPGKVLHEFFGVNIPRNGTMYNTLYCACDTTLLFLIGAARYVQQADFSRHVWSYLVPKIILAWGYVDAHTDDAGDFFPQPGLFFDDPSSCGARDFALKATYLRDGGLCGRRGRRLAHPASFLLVQAQMIGALRALTKLTQHGVFPEETHVLETKLQQAKEAFRATFIGTNEGFVVAQDKEGPIVLHNTDVGLALWYLDREDMDEHYKSRCLETLDALKTPWGWRSTVHALHPSRPGGHQDHRTLWPADQAFIALGLEKHGMLASIHRETALRTAEALAGSGVPFTEHLRIARNRTYAAGCHVQLWTAAYWAWVERQCAAQQVQASG